MNANANSIVQHIIQSKNGIIKHVNVNAKIIVSSKKIIGGIAVQVFVTSILHTFLLVIILILIITTICYNYAKQKGII